MDFSEADLYLYLAPPAGSYWKWQENGNVVAWSDGLTIAFRAEICSVLERLRTQSLPPLGSILLLLAACRDSWGQDNSRLRLLEQGLNYRGQQRSEHADLLARVMVQLDELRAMRPDLRKSVEVKAELAATIFEGKGKMPPRGAFDMLLDTLAHPLSEKYESRPGSASAAVAIIRDLSWLDHGLARVDESTLDLRMKTGLEQSLLPVEVEVPTVGSARSLIAQLRDDPVLGGVARLAQLLLSAVHVPAPISQPEELSAGGLSDISHRGALDRLLLSELAYDDLTLATRVAMNEALYLRREMPPRIPSRRQLVLLDSGLRMWGVPRVFATSVGLALAAGAKTGLEVDVYRAEAAKLSPVNLSTAAGITDHLATLDCRAHPGAALPAFRDVAAQAEALSDVVLVTGDDVLADPAFQRALRDAQFPSMYLASVRRDGRFQLHQRTLRGRKLLREATFALDNILQPTAKPTVKLLADPNHPLPAIFGVEPFPLLLSCPVNAARSWHVHHTGVWTYTRDGRLLHWTGPGRGAFEVASGLPEGYLRWANSWQIGGMIWAVIGKMSGRGLHVLLIDPKARSCQLVPLDCALDAPGFVFASGGVIFVVSNLQLWAFSHATGKLLASAPLDERVHGHGRFFFVRNGLRKRDWYAVSFDGQDLRWELISANVSAELKTIFDGKGSENPIGVEADGQLRSVNTNQPRKWSFNGVPEGMDLAIIARDGSKLLFRPNLGSREQYVVLDVRSLACHRQNVLKSPWNLVEPEIFGIARPVVLRHRFRGLGVDSERRLTLVGRRDTLWAISLDSRDGKLKLTERPGKAIATPLSAWSQFQVIDNTAANRYGLRRASFSDGSVAVLDKRGLLHLKSSDRSLPEITLVLANGEISGWVSSGLWWGQEYFIGDHAATSPRQIHDECLQRFVERLS